MTNEDEKRPAFRRRSTAIDDAAIAERAAQELEDLKSDKQWTGVEPARVDPQNTIPEAPTNTPTRKDEGDSLTRVQAMVPKSLRDDFLVATRRAGTTAQQAIADFVRGYIERRGERG